MEHLLKLIQESKIVKFVAPTGYGSTTILPKELGKAGYNVLVVVSDKKIADALNSLKYLKVKYIDTKKYNFDNLINIDILIIDKIDKNSLDNFLIIAHWTKYQNTKFKNVKLVLNSLRSHSFFPEAPYYTVKSSTMIEVRYVKPNIDIYKLIDAVRTTVEGNFLVYNIPQSEISDDMKKKLQHFNNITILNDGNGYIKDTKITCIFDTMLEERNEPTLTGGVRKKITYISKRDADIRASRSSLPSVIVYRMISEDDFNSLPQFSNEEISNMPLHHLMIDIYKRNLNPFEILSFLDIDDLNFIYNLFLKYGILDISNKLTSKAKLLRQIPFGIRPGILCLEGYTALASMIDNYNSSPFLFATFLPKVISEQTETYSVADYQIDYDVHIRKYYNKFRGDSDVETFLNIYNSSQSEISVSKGNLYTWCDENKISFEYMKNVYDSIDFVNKIVGSSEHKYMNLDSVITNLYNDTKMVLDEEKQIFTQYVKDDISYCIDSLAVNLIEEKRPKEIYGLITCKISDFHTVSFSYVANSTIFTEIYQIEKEEKEII